MAEEEVLYGVGTLTEIKKKMTGKPIAKHHDLHPEMQSQLMDAVQNGIEAYATVPNMPELASKSIK